jgi:uncharacterized membrane-anchored protein
MKHLVIALVTSLAVASANPTASVAKPPQTEQEREAAAKTLHWRDGETLTLPVSNGTVNAPGPAKQLVGPDARVLYEILNGVDAPGSLEATLLDPRTNEIVLLEKFGGGYVRLDDWNDVDAEGMLKSVTEATEEANAQRRTSGVPPLHVTGWLERPHLDRASNSVRWAIELQDEKAGPMVNSIALVLGRDGFEKLTWAGDKAIGERPLLKTGMSAFNFPAGGRYEDHQADDKVAEYGIAGLVAAVLGAKVASKLGIIALVAVFAKKLWWIVLVPVLVGFRWLKRLFTGREPPASPGS